MSVDCIVLLVLELVVVRRVSLCVVGWLLVVACGSPVVVRCLFFVDT